MTFQLTPGTDSKSQQASPVSGNGLHPSMLSWEFIQPMEFQKNRSPGLRDLFQITQPVTGDIFYAGVHILSMAPAASPAMMKMRALDSVLGSHLFPHCLEKLISIRELQFAYLEIRDGNASMAE